MKKVKEFNNVTFYKNDESDIFIQGKGKIGLLNKNLDFEYVLPILNDYQIVGNSKSYLIVTNFELTKFFNDGKEILMLTNFGYISNKGNLFLVENYDSGNILSFYLNCENILFEPTEIKRWGQVIWEKSVYIKTKNILTSYSLPDFTPLWAYELPPTKYIHLDSSGKEHAAEFRRMIGVYEDKLWVVLGSGVVLGLCTATGELLLEIKIAEYIGIEEPQKSWLRANLDAERNNFYLGLYLHLDTDAGVLFGLREKFYFEVDLQSEPMIMKVYDISESCEKYNITSNLPGYELTWSGDEIFFGQIDTEGNTVGIFSRHQKSIIWADRIGKLVDWRPIVQKIDYSAGRLYVLDGENTLHIFERE